MGQHSETGWGRSKARDPRTWHADAVDALALAALVAARDAAVRAALDVDVVLGEEDADAVAAAVACEDVSALATCITRSSLKWRA